MQDTGLTQRRWLRLWTGVAAALACVSPLFLSLGMVVFLLLLGCAGGGSITAGVLPRDRSTAREVLRARWRFVVRGCLLGGLWLVSVVTLACISSYLAVLVVAAAALTSPHVSRRWLRAPQPRRAGRPKGGALESDDRLLLRAASSVRGLDLQGLCWAWRRSYVALEEVRAPQARLGLVILRQIYLDEMERRHPEGFRAWLSSEAGPAGAPDRYLSRDEGEQDAA